MAPGLRADASSADWHCKSCKGRDGQPFKNFGHRASCRECGLSKGSCFGKKVEQRPPGASTSLAERQ
eukprot:7529440-Heterocapsa_arctica.AAC.1